LKEEKSFSITNDEKIVDNVRVWEDKTDPKRPPEEFFAFIKYSKYSRSKLIKTDRDVFIISGQNGLFAWLVILTYLSVWLLNLG
jgi:hypothetical protein